MGLVAKTSCPRFASRDAYDSMKKNRPRRRRNVGVTNEQIIQALRELGNEMTSPPGSLERLRVAVFAQIDAEAEAEAARRQASVVVLDDGDVAGVGNHPTSIDETDVVDVHVAEQDSLIGERLDQAVAKLS